MSDTVFTPLLNPVSPCADEVDLRERFGLLSEVGQLLLPQSLLSTTVILRVRPSGSLITLIVVT